MKRIEGYWQRLCAAALLAAAAALGGDRAAAADWPPATAPEDAALAAEIGAELDEAVRAGRLENLHAVLVLRRGRLLVERYYAGADERWGEPLGEVRFGPDSLHDLRSVTKSVVGLLYGIALADGLVPPPEAPLLEQFPEYADLASDPARRRMTVGHALSMQLGTQWDESLPYGDPRNGEHAMELAADRYRFVLDRPMAAEPGRRWTYNGGTSALLGRLIEKGSGRSLHDFARSALFEPLGIGESEWIRGRDGAFAAASGLRLTARDLARIGQTVLDGGRHGDRQVVPEAWLRESFVPRVRLDELDYGYQWWLGTSAGGPVPWVSAFGNGGQRLHLSRGPGLVMVVLAGNYDRPAQRRLGTAILTEILLPKLAR